MTSQFYDSIKHRAVRMLPDGEISSNQVWYALFHARDDVATILTRASSYPLQRITASIFTPADFKLAMFEIKKESEVAKQTS
jgi:hypothetical protein